MWIMPTKVQSFISYLNFFHKGHCCRVKLLSVDPKPKIVEPNLLV